MLDYLVGIAALHGHDPREARAYARRDLEIIALLHNTQPRL